MSYVFWGSIFGRNWKYIVLVISLVGVIGYFIFLLTGNMQLAQIISIFLFFPIYAILIWPAYRDKRREIEYYKDHDKRMEMKAASLQIDEEKCMSCLNPLGNDSKKCPNCGYEN